MPDVVAGVGIYRTAVASDWIDYNGHLRDAYYGLIVSHAIDALMERIGLDAAYRERTSCTLYTLELHMHYLREIKADATVSADVRVLGADRKRIHAAFDLLTPSHAEPAACAEAMLLHVRQSPEPRGEPFSPEIIAALSQLQESTAALPASQFGSRQIRLPGR